MKAKAFTLLISATLLAIACTKKEDTRQDGAEGIPIDTTVVGKDISPVSTRKGIENSDEQKLTLPGRDSTNSNEPKK